MNDCDWLTFTQAIDRDLLPKLKRSRVTVSLLPADNAMTDAKFAVELGFSIMFDKPIIVLAHPDSEIPEHLQRVADLVIVADMDTEEGQQTMADGLTEWLHNSGVLPKQDTP